MGMGSLKELLDRLWDDYVRLNPQAQAIHRLLGERGEAVVNDHIAFRTYDDPRVGIEALSRSFVAFGYEQAGEYTFPEKKLIARHYAPPRDGSGGGDRLPKVFISELKVGEFSESFGRVVKGLVDQVPTGLVDQWDFAVSGRPWGVSYSDYELLRAQSEYGAWLAAFGFRANHFTVDVGELTAFGELAAFNAFVKDNGFDLNTNGGEIKGSQGVYLEQSSTLAARVPVAFSDGEHVIPACYYEFAKRYTKPNGELFDGFVAKSADKIFESTDRRD